MNQLSLFNEMPTNENEYEALECTEERPCVICCKFTEYHRHRRQKDKSVLGDLIKMHQEKILWEGWK